MIGLALSPDPLSGPKTMTRDHSYIREKKRSSKYLKDKTCNNPHEQIEFWSRKFFKISLKIDRSKLN